jgi:hypothetical protein
VGATETSLALFKALESAIFNHIAQIGPRAPRIILSFDGGRKRGGRSNNTERKREKLHLLPHVPMFVIAKWITSMSPFGDSFNASRRHAPSRSQRAASLHMSIWRMSRADDQPPSSNAT